MDQQNPSPWFKVIFKSATVLPIQGGNQRYRLEAEFQVNFHVLQGSFGPVALEMEKDSFYQDNLDGEYEEPKCWLTSSQGDLCLSGETEGKLPPVCTLHMQSTLFLKPTKADEFRRSKGAPVLFRLEVWYDRRLCKWDSEVYKAEYLNRAGPVTPQVGTTETNWVQ
jgi:hypothetical protein